MTSYMIHAGMFGFLIVLAINLLNDNGIGVTMMRACIGALAFAFVGRWFMRGLFSELHLAVWEQQQAAATQAQAQAQTPAETEEEPAEETA